MRPVAGARKEGAESSHKNQNHKNKNTTKKEDKWKQKKKRKKQNKKEKTKKTKKTKKQTQNGAGVPCAKKGGWGEKGQKNSDLYTHICRMKNGTGERRC